MNTFELILAIRQQILEYDQNPISDATIMTNLNLAYTFMYSHVVRSNDSRFGEKIYLPVTAGITEYALPKSAWGQRVEQLVVPFPPTNNDLALGFHQIKRVDYKEVYKHNVPRIRTWVPEVWSVLNQTLYIYPKPITSMNAYLIISPQLVPLGITVGSILTMTAPPVITLDGMNNTDLTDALVQPLNALLSVTDFQSGKVKQLYNYSTVVGNNVTLANTARTTYRAKPVTQISGANIYPTTTPGYDVTLTPVQDDLITAGYTTALSQFGDEYDQFLINQTVLKIRSSLNENDPEILNAMKENMAQLKGDLAGRPTGIHIQRDFGRGCSYTRPGRIQ